MYTCNQIPNQRIIPGYIIINEPQLPLPPLLSNKRSKKKITFEKNLRNVLSLSTADPQNKGLYGAFWFNGCNCIAANSKILERTMHIKANSVNRNFRDHQFERIGKIPISESIFLPDPKNWSIFRDRTNRFQRNQLKETNKLLSWKPKTRNIKNNSEACLKKDNINEDHQENYFPDIKNEQQESPKEERPIIRNSYLKLVINNNNNNDDDDENVTDDETEEEENENNYNYGNNLIFDENNNNENNQFKVLNDNINQKNYYPILNFILI